MKKFLGMIFAAVVLFSSCSNQLDGSNTVNSSDLSSRSVSSESVSETMYGRLTGVNWFGFETGNYAPHGLWTRDYKSMLQQIYDLGFNCVRLPWCNEMLDGDPSGIQVNAYGVDAYTGQTGINVDLDGLSSIEVMDKILDECKNLGLYVILDNHSRAADAYLEEALWYTSSFTEEEWISDWVMLAERYEDNEFVIGADLNNEPHDEATWGDDSVYDWKLAAETCGLALLDVNPNLLILVEGIEEYNGENYWWGGNLAGVESDPITAIPEENLVYSPHEYGPEVYDQEWFSDDSFPDNMPDIWDEYFWFIYKENISPLLFGEFGIKEESAADTTCTSYIWFTEFMKYVGYDSSWTFWCMNPNSGDTGGILQDDWVSVNTAKYSLIEPYLEPQEADDNTNDSDDESDTEAPSVPTNLTSVATSSSVTLSWNEVSDIDLDSYNIYRGNSTADFSLIGSALSTTYVDSDLSSETTYVYGVSAVDISNNESDKVILSVSTFENEDDSADSEETGNSDISVVVVSTNTDALTNTIGLKVKFTNEGDVAVNLSDVTFRYYLSNESDGDLVFWCDYAGGMFDDVWESITSNIVGTFGSVDTAVEGATSYFELSFDSEAGSLKSDGYVEVQLRITNDSWSNFDQSDDYSYETDGILYVDGDVISGTLPN
jgi:aryl-phospho-beta-D-glucosidase BglC (GH1 family)